MIIDANLINPFLKSIHNVMETMLNVKPEQAAPFVKKDNLTNGDVSGIIGFTESNCAGSIVISFPENTALKVFKLLTGESSNRIGTDVQDAIGEMANMVAGGAKSDFSKTGLSFHLSIPTVVVGRNHMLNHSGNLPVMVVPMSLGDDKFTMEVAMKLGNGNNDGRKT